MAQYDLGKVSIRPRGAYAANTNYEFLDSVQNLGGSWLALAASKDVQPGVTAGWQNYWMMITRGIKTIVGSSPADGQTKITITFTDGATATYTYNNEVLADGSVTRVKLAQDALYSPVVNVSAEVTNFIRALTVSDLGKTLACRGTYGITFTLTQANSAQMPAGTEIAIFDYTGNTQKITGTDVRMVIADGETPAKNRSFTFSADRFGMIALKKMFPDNVNGDLWLVTGNAEVV